MITGSKTSEAHKKKISEGLKRAYREKKRLPGKYWLGKERSKETSLKISRGLTGKKLTKEHRKALSDSHIGQHNSPETQFKKGHRHNENWKEAMAERTGDKHQRWKGGYDRKLWHNNQRRVTRLGNGGSHTFEEWETLKDKNGDKCIGCKERKKLTRDHIIPLSKGGTDDIENIQPLCRSCNCKKRDKLISYIC